MSLIVAEKLMEQGHFANALCDHCCERLVQLLPLVTKTLKHVDRTNHIRTCRWPFLAPKFQEPTEVIRRSVA